MKINKENVKNNRIVRHVYYFANGVVHNKKLRQNAEKTIKQFGYKIKAEHKKKKIITDMVRMNMLYGYGFDEYIYFHFAKRSLKERRAFIADWEHLGYTCTMNNPDNADIFDNKWKTFKKFSDYYHRDVEYCEGDAGKNIFKSFIARHLDVVIKPLDDCCGHGVQIIHADNVEDYEQLYSELLRENNGRFIIEELIHQSRETEVFHPSSVNTVRIPTITIGDEVNFVHPYFRVGQHGNHVDNGGSGGILCNVNVDTGEIYAAADEYGREYIVHPDTGVQLIGSKVPKWDEAKNFVKKLTKVVPDNHYTGWDIALIDSGWIMIEANRRGQFAWQIAAQKGNREEVNGYLSKLGVRY